MIQRLITGWTWTRGIYLFTGSWVILQSALEGQWMGIFLGAWPAGMGLFGLGCAARNYSGVTCEKKPDEGLKITSEVHR